ncbi:hypothetical protein I7I51_02528 [Histoplasma capsulatum]|uniref:Uncharacterized protein n=1 Tax=Ajellomyces capsulatus TaxID=5037 RepID=A0A8A1M8E0_AJECA|nr:predicted protein [Histoplasma mississippiense (nom. inval.)]EDN04384.1 predicted protein [Histoplasma mississippiense (nom. inval.)]QSS62788.1 hypothetical protein I7I51_02528 [Histoplasma capsulatum]
MPKPSAAIPKRQNGAALGLSGSARGNDLMLQPWESCPNRLSLPGTQLSTVDTLTIPVPEYVVPGCQAVSARWKELGLCDSLRTTYGEESTNFQRHSKGASKGHCRTPTDYSERAPCTRAGHPDRVIITQRYRPTVNLASPKPVTY